MREIHVGTGWHDLAVANAIGASRSPAMIDLSPNWRFAIRHPRLTPVRCGRRPTGAIRPVSCATRVGATSASNSVCHQRPPRYGVGDQSAAVPAAVHHILALTPRVCGRVDAGAVKDQSQWVSLPAPPATTFPTHNTGIGAEVLSLDDEDKRCRLPDITLKGFSKKGIRPLLSQNLGERTAKLRTRLKARYMG